MAADTSQIQAELLQIELAIELDQGKSVSEVAEKFGLTIAVVKEVAKKSGSAEPKIKKIKTRRFSTTEQTVLVERLARGEALEDIAAEFRSSVTDMGTYCLISTNFAPDIS